MAKQRVSPVVRDAMRRSKGTSDLEVAFECAAVDGFGKKTSDDSDSANEKKTVPVLKKLQRQLDAVLNGIEQLASNTSTVLPLLSDRLKSVTRLLDSANDATLKAIDSIS